MLRTVASCIFAALVVVGSMVAAAMAGQERRHSGVLEGVAVGARIITMQEIGPGSTSHRRTVRLTSQTRIALALRSEDGPTTDHWAGEFMESPLKPADLRPGDFVTVTVTGKGDELFARSIDVVRPVPEQGPPATQ